MCFIQLKFLFALNVTGMYLFFLRFASVDKGLLFAPRIGSWDFSLLIISLKVLYMVEL